MGPNFFLKLNLLFLAEYAKNLWKFDKFYQHSDVKCSKFFLEHIGTWNIEPRDTTRTEYTSRH